MLEAFDLITAVSGKTMNYEYVDKNREGDHICYISDLTKLRMHYPSWSITKTLDNILVEIYDAQRGGGTRGIVLG